MAFRTPRPVEALRIRLPAQPVPVPPPCTARGSAAPLPPSHRGVNHALTVEDDAARRALPTTYDCGSSTRPTSPGPLKFGSDHPAGKPPLTRRPAHPRACDVTRPPGPRMHSSPTCAGPRWYSGPTVRQSTEHARGSGITLCPPLRGRRQGAVSHIASPCGRSCGRPTLCRADSDTLFRVQ